MKNVLRVVPCFAVLAVVMLAGCSSGHLPTAKDVGYAMGWWNVLSDEERVASLYGTEATEAQAAAAMKSYDALDGLTKTKVNFAAGEIFAGGFGSVGEWWETLNCRTMRIAAGDGNTADPTSPYCAHYPGSGKTPYLGDAMPFAEDVERWDRFYERAADPELLAGAQDCRRRLLETLPADAPVGLFHGDFQTSNLFFDARADGATPKLLAIIDWELTGIGATLNDIGWICTFSDRDAWAKGEVERPMFLAPDTLMALYVDAYGDPLPDLNWFRALAAYKFAIITGFNLSLHRRGKRVDPSWEATALSMTPLIDRALELLG